MWTSASGGEPARSWRSSTFCVTRSAPGISRPSRASARCAELGSARESAARRSRYHSQTVSGSDSKASRVASS